MRFACVCVVVVFLVGGGWVFSLMNLFRLLVWMGPS